MTSLLSICWGYCPGYNVRQHLVYRVGDAIRWRVCRDGTIPPSTFFGASECNVGDPAYENLVLLDHSMIGETHACLTRVGGAAVEVRGGVITKAWVFRPGEFEDDDTTSYLIGEDGELTSMWEGEGRPPNWIDPEACGELRFATALDRGPATDAPSR
jgi:hypothetical protein